MLTIHNFLDEKLLQATDRAARQFKQSRSAFVREALREYLRRLEIRELEVRNRKGYLTHPPAKSEYLGWETEAAWPEE